MPNNKDCSKDYYSHHSQNSHRSQKINRYPFSYVNLLIWTNHNADFWMNSATQVIFYKMADIYHNQFVIVSCYLAGICLIRQSFYILRK